MAMTEKQGGSDVRANTTRAEPVGDGWYEITGHKWFCSYPPCDVFLVLAQAPAGLSCFLVERGDPGMEFQRLKDKLGTRSLPSSEVEFRGVAGAAGRRGGARRADDHRDGQPHAAGLPDRLAPPAMRRGVAEAVHHARHRSAFGALLAEQPAMQQRARRPGARVRGRDRDRVARWRAPTTRSDTRLPALRHRGR